MPAIGDREAAECYRVGVSVHSGSLTEAQAISKLVGTLAMNRSSAGGYVRVLRHMLKGEVYKRTLNAASTKYYLDSIYDDFGKNAFSNATRSLKLHIDYYRGHGKTRMPALQTIADQAEARIVNDEQHRTDENFSNAVADAKCLSPKARRDLLPPRGTKPQVKEVLVKYFVRNPYVVAQVLINADGICQSCKRTAPFISQRSGDPYLEVHHRITLAAGGDDTIENAMAVCPNCHRELHFGRLNAVNESIR